MRVQINRNLRVFAVAAFVALAISGGVSAKWQPTFVTIGTGGVTGVYYPTGGAICRLVNKTRKDHGVRCSVESTGGSVYNLNSIRAGELDMAVAQADLQDNAFNGEGKFSSAGANVELRSLFSLHPEPFTIVARADSGIKTIADLKGKRVNIGNPGSGQYEMMDTMMTHLGWSRDDFKLVSQLKSAEQAGALCDNKVDAIVFTAGHPSGSIKEATSTCESKIVDVSGPAVDKMVKSNSSYRKTTIPGGMYNGNSKDVDTFYVDATFVSSSDVDDEIIYVVVKSLFENFDAFKQLHPTFSVLNKDEMVSGNLSAPLHDGALKYYKEAGLVN